MVITPKIINNVCLTSHPKGCAADVNEQIAYIKSQSKIEMAKKVLVIGCSTGYGLASRITAAYAGGAETLGVSFEKGPSAKRPGSAGWYNNRAFDQAAAKDGLLSHTIDGDAFSDEVKTQVIEWIKENWGQVDLIVYSLASPVRKDPDSGELYKSVLKPIKETYTAQSVDYMKGTISTVSIDPADPSEIEPTVKVMGGEDWIRWCEKLLSADVLADGIKTVAYSYVGPQITYPVYREGTIGKAKEDLEASAKIISDLLKVKSGLGFVSVNKALVTRASAVIPVVPLYMALLFKVMKEKGIHEGCIEQMHRLFDDRLYNKNGEVKVDESGLIRVDDWELRDDVQWEVSVLWDIVNEENLEEVSDIAGYRQDYLRLHGFAIDGINYEEDVDLLADID